MADSAAQENAPSNLVHLGILDTDSMVNAVRSRFLADVIYTYVGDMLLAVNPMKLLDIYGPAEKARHLPGSAIAIEPHIFAVAQKAYMSLCSNQRSQCCLISGESGAGKTETAKLFIGHLLSFEGHSTSVLQRQILESQPLLEAFGNAKTGLNDNSSRFGKYIEILYNRGSVCGARVSQYLLEKSRVVARAEGESNFHVFYYLLTGSPGWIREGLGMEDESRYEYLTPGGGLIEPLSAAAAREAKRRSSKYQFAGADLVSDVAKYEELTEALHILDFDEDLLGQVHTVVMAVLVAGNILFVPDPDSDGDRVVIRSSAPLMQFGLLTGVDPHDVAYLLTTKHIHLRNDSVAKALSLEEAATTRDTLAKTIYDRLFGWLVDSLNKQLGPRTTQGGHQHRELLEIGVLDIFGFEDFGVNGLEQLCINTANEQLQYYFNNCIFEWELREYKKEGVPESAVSFSDNGAQISLLLGRPLGIFSVIDEESKFPRATDHSLAAKLAQNFKKGNTLFCRDRLRPELFGVVHYAGCVWYSTSGALERNRNSFSPELTKMMHASPLLLVRQLFSTARKDSPMASMKKKIKQKRHQQQLGGNMTWRLKGILKSKSSGGGTLGTMFRISLGDLMGKLEYALPHFIRCIKPNMQKVPGKFEAPFVQQQLQYSGVLETCRIRKEGFAVRIKFSDFVEQYKIIAFNLSTRLSTLGINECTAILNAAELTGWVFGRTKVFLKFQHSTVLLELMTRYHRCASIIARCVRKYQAYKILSRLRKDRERADAVAVALQEKERLKTNALAAAETSPAETATVVPATSAHSVDNLQVRLERGRVSSDSFVLSPISIIEEEVEEGGTLQFFPDTKVMAAAETPGQASTTNSHNPPLSGSSQSVSRALSGPVKGADPAAAAAKEGTITKGDVGAARAIFQAMMKANHLADGEARPAEKRGTLTKGIDVSKAARAMKINFPALESQQGALNHGPALPQMAPWTNKPWKKSKKYRQGIGAIAENDEKGGGGRRNSVINSFLAELSMSRLYARHCLEAGINEPLDFLLFKDSELVDLGFKAAHAKKLKGAAKKLKRRSRVT